MDSILKFFGEVLKTHGFLAVIFLMVVGVGTYAAFVAINRWSKTPLPKQFLDEDITVKTAAEEPPAVGTAEEFEIAEFCVEDLLKHQIFAYLQHAIKVKIPHLPIDDPMKREAFRDLLGIKFLTFETKLRTFLATRNDLDQMPREQFQFEVSGLISSSVHEYEVLSRSEGIPVEILEVFTRWHDRTVSLIYDLVSSMATSNFYKSNTYRMLAILDWLMAAFQLTLVDAEKALDSLNGELHGKMYKGLKSHCKDGTFCAICDNPKRRVKP